MSGQGATIRQAYRFELAPTPEQAEQLLAFTGAARFWFNVGLELVKRRLDERAAGADVSVPWSYNALCSEFAPVKNEVCPWRDEVIVGCQQTGLQALGQALQYFSTARAQGRRVGFPRFKAKGRCKERVFSQEAKLVDARHVSLPKIGAIRTREKTCKLAQLLERDPQARILRGTVSRSRSERWFIAFQVERSPKHRRARQPDTAIGVDLGLARLATLSTGRSFANGRPLQGSLRRLRRMQRRLDRQRRANNPTNYLSDGRVKPGSSEWVRSRRMLRTEHQMRRLHDRVANVRREQAHQLTTLLTREYGVIGVETLAIKNLRSNRRLARHIADVGWGLILAQLGYKTSWSDGSVLVSADRFYPSSKICSACGTAKAKLSLSERVFTCATCGLVEDRDVNAALNLAQLAMRHTHTEGSDDVHVAATGAETQNARGGQVRPGGCVGHGPLKREGPQGHPSAARRWRSQLERSSYQG